MATNTRIVLASSSVYRRELLSRLLPGFESLAPDVDEAAVPGETPAQMAARLAELKARHCAALRPAAIVIGSDQVPNLGGRVLRKPGGRDAAISQLGKCSGRAVTFLTAVTVVSPDRGTDAHIDETVVRFRNLTADEIMRYVDAEQPFDCAGSFKVEGLGITLFDGVDSNDPTALQGLPLIWLAASLRRLGVALP